MMCPIRPGARPGLWAIATSALGEVHGFRHPPIACLCKLSRQLGRFGNRGAQGRGESHGELVLRLQFHDILELLCGRLFVSLHHVVVREQESASRSGRVLPYAGFEIPELVGIGVHVGVEPHHRGPVPAGSGSEDGVSRRC